MRREPGSTPCSSPFRAEHSPGDTGRGPRGPGGDLRRGSERITAVGERRQRAWPERNRGGPRVGPRGGDGGRGPSAGHGPRQGGAQRGPPLRRGARGRRPAERGRQRSARSPLSGCVTTSWPLLKNHYFLLRNSDMG